MVLLASADFKTRTLRTADFNAPYFHDVRFTPLVQVVDYFDRSFTLGYSAQDRADMVAYLKAIGDATQPYERITTAILLQDIFDFASVLGTAIQAHDNGIITLTVAAVGGNLNDLMDRIPEQGAPGVRRREERELARNAQRSRRDTGTGRQQCEPLENTRRRGANIKTTITL